MILKETGEIQKELESLNLLLSKQDWEEIGEIMKIYNRNKIKTTFKQAYQIWLNRKR